MSDGTALAKMIFVIGIVTLFATLVYPTNGPGNSFKTFQNGITGSMTIPTFVNPYAGQVFNGTVDVATYAPVPAGSAPNAVFNNGSVNGCVLATYWYCLRTQDGPSSYVRFGPGPVFLDFAMNARDNINVTQITKAVATIQCRTVAGLSTKLAAVNWLFLNSSNGQMGPGWLNSGGGNWGPFQCPRTTFGNFTFDYCSILCGDSARTPFKTKVPDTFLQFDRCNTAPTTCANGEQVEVSFLSLTISFTKNTAPCPNVTFQFFSGGPSFSVPDIGCYIAHFVDTIGKFFSFIFDGAVYIVTTIAVLVNIFITDVVNLLIGLFNAVTWFYKIPTSDAAPCSGLGGTGCIPTTVQLFVSALFTGMVGYMVYLISKLLRGSGPV